MSAQERPNILIFMTDQERGDVVEPDHPCPTPHADRLARDGVRFTHCYTPYAHCCPARATFMTGLYPSRHGVFNNVRTRTAINRGLRENVVTFSEKLRDAGYDLTLCGKWHVSAEETPADRGWREREVTASSGTFHSRSIEQWRQGAPGEESEPRARGHVQRPGWGDFVVYKTLPDAGPKAYEDFHDHAVVQAAVETLHDYSRQEDPWCLFVGPIGPHDPFNVPQKFVDKIDPATVKLPASYADTLERALFDAHKAAQEKAAADAEADAEQDIPIEFVDEEVEEAREEIEDAEAEAEIVAREKEKALEVAREARTEALRLVANEHARLLGVKEQQARYAASLPRWKQDSKALHESALEWHRRVRELADSGDGPEEVAAQADMMYFELRGTLSSTRAYLAEALDRLAAPGRDIPTAGRILDDDALPADVERADLLALRRELASRVDDLRAQEIDTGWEVADLLRDDIVLLNHDRLELLDLASRSVRASVTGLGADGLDQVRGELNQIALELRYHAMSLPRDTRNFLGYVRKNPVDFGLVVVQLLLALVVFRWWRSRADEILKRWQYPSKGSGPPGRLTRFVRRIVWYLRRIRKPVEWLLLLAVFPYVLSDVDTAPELVLLWLTLVWVLGGWTAFALIDAIAARQQYYGFTGASAEKLRHRSLRLLGITITSVGLILSLTAEIVGTGAIYNWVWQTCWILAAPIGIWLVLSWRTTIYERIGNLKRERGVLVWVAKTQTGLAGFFAALVGGLYLITMGVARLFGRYLGDLDATRKVLAYLFRREVLKRAEAQAHRKRGPRIEQELYDQLGPQAPAEPTLQGPAKKMLEHALELSLGEATTMTTVVGERGSGKSTFLRRLCEQSDDRTVIVDCPPQGFDALLAGLAKAFDTVSADPEALAKTIREAGPCLICIDDAHSMIAPAVGGLAQLDSFTRFALEVGGDVSWMVAVQRAAWNFVQRARGDRVFFDQVLELPRWTEAEISELIRSRTKAVGIAPGFDELVVNNVVDESEAAQGKRTEASYYRILWDHSAGNPAVALHAWRESLFTHEDDDEIVVRLFNEPSATQIETLPLTLLFVLRAVVQLEIASVAEIALCTQLPEADVADALRFSIGRGYVEAVGGRFYRLAWPWYRTITTVLTRQHLLVA